jgi:hypothetical protein
MILPNKAKTTSKFLSSKEKELFSVSLSLSPLSIEAMEAGSANQRTNQTTHNGLHNTDHAKSNSSSPYSGAVAQRALFGSTRCRITGRRISGKEGKPAPSRLSKMSAAENAGS